MTRLFLPTNHPYASKLVSYASWQDQIHVEQPIRQGTAPDLVFLVSLLRSRRTLGRPVREQLATWVRTKRFKGPPEGGRPRAAISGFKDWTAITRTIEEGGYPDRDQLAKGLIALKPVPVSVRMFLAGQIETGRLLRNKGRGHEINPILDDITKVVVGEIFRRERALVEAERVTIDPRAYWNKGNRQPLEEIYVRTATALSRECGIHISAAKVRQIREGGGKWK